MTKIGLFYGSEMGHTKRVAGLISKEFGNEITIEDIGYASSRQMQKYDILIFGVPTWDDGKLDWNWEWFLPYLHKIDFTGKKVALFGLGDQERYDEVFLGAMATIYKKLKAKGAKIVGEWPVEGYANTKSSAIRNNKFVGLAIDEDNQADLTKDRVKQWVAQLKQEFREKN
ncbi:MAG: flavodoxin [Candidatus Thorarchaeota archaeon]